MEHIPRLAVLEQKFCFSNSFEKFLQMMLQCIERVIKETKSSIPVDDIQELSNALKVDGTIDYLNYIGFILSDDVLTFSSERDVNSLSTAKAAIESKLKLCVKPRGQGAIKKTTASCHTKAPVSLGSHNNFIRQIEQFSRQVLCYESEELQERARQCIPTATLQVKAMRRIREQQKDIKNGSGETEMPFETAMLRELVNWFKSSFFSWVDRPSCECGARTEAVNTVQRRVAGEVCRVEIYKCPSCGLMCDFVRYNDPGALLRTRRGRCGEWANCFALMCRSLGYDARFVVDTTDHVWCEVYNMVEQRWSHVDPCEAAIDTPLMYEHGWGKKLQYVIGYSYDDVQDVTWRYSSHHAKVRSRRDLCSESELLEALTRLRESLQSQLTVHRRKFLQLRTVKELAEMLVERKPSDYESKGRSSGSEEWRRRRGEYGQRKYAFRFATCGEYDLLYSSAEDRYQLLGEGDHSELNEMSWHDAVWECDNMRRKEEADWAMAYLARVDGSKPGRISWRFEVGDGLKIDSITVNRNSQVYSDGRIDWSVSLDDGEYTPIQFNEREEVTLWCEGDSVTLLATLSLGAGDASWQHAQLFRATLASRTPAPLARVAVNQHYLQLELAGRLVRRTIVQ